MWNLLAKHSHAVVHRPVPETWHKDLPWQPIVHWMLKGDAAIMPRLLAIDPDAPWFGRLVDNLKRAVDEPEYRLPCALLAVAPGTRTDALRVHLEERLVLYAGRSRTYCRYFDPSVFPKLLRIFAPIYIDLLFGPVETWTIPFQKEWISFTPPRVEKKAMFWRASEQQWESIERIRFVNRLLSAREAQIGPWANFQEYEKAAMLADEVLQEARQHHGLEDEGEIMAFAFNALTHQYQIQRGWSS